ncbi:MAG: dTDP-glucose 4,6-dehydratase [Gammaproteobacteria bacterium]|nr:dTDP-glucose 4,6-dehydratase [Gammaproteobacteria bacterium]
MKFMITGGSGFIGSALIRLIIKETNHQVLNVDKLTYAGSADSTKEVSSSENYEFSRTDICDKQKLRKIIGRFSPDRIVHLAAESHVDRSLDSPENFVNTNIIGTFALLEEARRYLNKFPEKNFLFHHVSTDEVYGSLTENGKFSENSPYDPRSPYAASKASSDHLVRAWGKTFRLPFIVTNCSNNYGPYQFPEKLIPLTITNAINKKNLPIYGNGKHVRDWLYVEDHARALLLAALRGTPGETYNIGGSCEKNNLEVVKKICGILQALQKGSRNFNYETLIKFSPDRPGHDYRYAIDASKLRKSLGWAPQTSFESGLKSTVEWYINNKDWCKKTAGTYNQERLGLGKDGNIDAS